VVDMVVRVQLPEAGNNGGAMRGHDQTLERDTEPKC
jgi:hypothetical protein